MDQNTLTVRYTWGEIEYNVNILRQQALKFIHPSEFNNLFSRCSNSLVKRLNKISSISLSDCFRKDISILLEPLISYESSLVYFIKAPRQMLNYHETIRLFRNTLVLPCLIWE